MWILTNEKQSPHFQIHSFLIRSAKKIYYNRFTDLQSSVTPADCSELSSRGS